MNLKSISGNEKHWQNLKRVFQSQFTCAYTYKIILTNEKYRPQILEQYFFNFSNKEK